MYIGLAANTRVERWWDRGSAEKNSAIKDGIMPGRRVFEKSGNDCHGRLVPDSSLQRVDTRTCREREGRGGGGGINRPVL